MGEDRTDSDVGIYHAELGWCCGEFIDEVHLEELREEIEPKAKEKDNEEDSAADRVLKGIYNVNGADQHVKVLMPSFFFRQGF